MEITAFEAEASYILSFYAVAKSGSLIAASEQGLGALSTLSRHISALETQLGAPLFERRSSGMILTNTGTRLFEHAELMHQAKVGFALAADGLGNCIEGTVKIAASTATATSLLPSIIAQLAEEEPSLSIDIIASERSANILMGEADIALRSYRPKQSNLIAKRVGQYEMGTYGAKTYFDRHAVPTTVAELRNHRLIGDEGMQEFYESQVKPGMPISRDAFRMRTDSKITAWSMLLAGCGIGMAPVEIGGLNGNLIRVLPDELSFTFPLWLVANPNIRTNFRTRRVFDFISAHLAASQS